MNCYTCELQREIDAYTAWLAAPNGEAPITDERRAELAEACLQCGHKNARNGGDTFKHSGLTQVEWNDSVVVVQEATPFRLHRTRDTTEAATPLDPATEDALRKLLIEFARVEYKHVGVLLGLLKGESFAEIGAQIGQTKQFVFKIVHKSFRLYPWVKGIALRVRKR